MYERAYRTWFNIQELALSDTELLTDCLARLHDAFPKHPHFPENLKVDNSFVNSVLVKGKSTWIATQDPDHLPPFQHEVIFPVGWDKPTPLILTSDLRRVTTTLPDIFDGEQNHIPILIQAWAYILSARWAELIDAAQLSESHGCRESRHPTSNGPQAAAGDASSIIVHIGEVEEDAAHWWNTILHKEGGWDATIRSYKGDILYSPWSMKLVSDQLFVISAKFKTTSSPSKHKPANSTTAYRYLSKYCHLHGIEAQKQAALAAALLIPVAKWDRRPIKMTIPNLLSHERDIREGISIDSPPKSNKLLLDRLLTLSCNPRGVKSLLASIFFEPGVTSNICGIWLQGSLAFLDTAKDPKILLRTLVKRDPELGALWLGAFITGAHYQTLQRVRGARLDIDLAAAAWTETSMSFIQAPVLVSALEGREKISRADEARLLYLCHDIDHSIPPLFPFEPFGFTALEDTNLDVHEHALCGKDHYLGYVGFAWACQGGKMVEQGMHDPPATTIRAKYGQFIDYGVDINIDYEDIDSEDDRSEMVTLNIFTWLREQDGFPIAERAIREHEWLADLRDDDNSPVQGDVRSTVGGDNNVGGWILKTSTQRSNSI
ncbi:hypothetical protein BGZ63DRAFT_481612 [Mariannaea sp. PMI_226]|nr:hypothetical protein BGZ63DRAFT_481612 [Mariannaea sp. PMI_226]